MSKPKGKNENGYVGNAGQLAVMSEFCIRGYNVAKGEVDRGYDVFAVNEKSGAYWRIQVKTSTPEQQVKSKAYQYNVNEEAIIRPLAPELYFLFVMRVKSTWRYAMIERSVLCNYVVVNRFGHLHSNGVSRKIRITLHDDGRLTSHSVLDLTHHLDAWANWPTILQDALRKCPSE